MQIGEKRHTVFHGIPVSSIFSRMPYETKAICYKSDISSFAFSNAYETRENRSRMCSVVWGKDPRAGMVYFKR